MTKEDRKNLIHQTREGWLLALVTLLRAYFAQRLPDHPLPEEIRVTCGLPSKRAFARKKRRIGEAWSSGCSADGAYETIVSATIDDAPTVAHILVHELIHHAVGLACGHKGDFRRAALALGLEGRMTATHAGKDLAAHLERLLTALGPYPHGALVAHPGKTQKTRLLKADCSHADCPALGTGPRGGGYTVRVTRTTVENWGPPVCGACGEPMEVQGL